MSSYRGGGGSSQYQYNSAFGEPRNAESKFKTVKQEQEVKGNLEVMNRARISDKMRNVGTGIRHENDPSKLRFGAMGIGQSQPVGAIQYTQTQAKAKQAFNFYDPNDFAVDDGWSSDEKNEICMFNLAKTFRNGKDFSVEERRAETFKKQLMRQKEQLALNPISVPEPDPNANQAGVGSRGVLLTLTDLEALSNEMRIYKEMFTQGKFSGPNLSTTSSSSPELESLRKELRSLKEQVEAKEKNATVQRTLEMCNSNAEALETIRTDISMLRQCTNLDLSSQLSTVGELRKTLQACCTQWALTIQKVTCLEEEVLCLKRKLAETETKNQENGQTVSGALSSADYRAPLGPPLATRIPRKTYVVAQEEKVVDEENSGIDFMWRQQHQQSNNSFSTSFRRPLTTLASSEERLDDQENVVGIESDGEEDVLPDDEMSGAIFNSNEELNVTNLTDALHCRPKPIHSSSPDRRVSRDKENERERQTDENSTVLPLAPHPQQRFMYPYVKRSTFNQTMEQVAQDLSTIQETSKERSSAVSSSSSNLTAFSSLRGTSAIQIRSASKSSATSTRYYNHYN